MSTTITSKEISIILQGTFFKNRDELGFNTIDVVIKWRALLPESQIILSIWNHPENNIQEVDLIVVNKDPGPTYRKNEDNINSKENNISRIIVSSKNGLKYANRLFAVKCRTDIMPDHANFINIFLKKRKLLKDYLIFSDHVVTCEFCTLNPEKTTNHIHVCDIFHFGYTCDILMLWNIDVPVPTYKKDLDIWALDFYGKPILVRDKYPRPEQYMALKLFQKKFPDLQLNHVRDDNYMLQLHGEFLVFNNFTIRNHRDIGITLPARMLGNKHLKTYNSDTIIKKEIECLSQSRCQKKLILMFKYYTCSLISNNLFVYRLKSISKIISYIVRHPNFLSVENKKNLLVDKIKVFKNSFPIRALKMKEIKIAIYVVRYKETDALYDCLRSIKNHPNTYVCVINNYDRLKLHNDFNHVQVLDNLLRPDFSTGHLARNWNQAIINGFSDLDNPTCDVVISLQADAKLSPNWYEEIIKLDNKIDYMSLGRGDEFQYFTTKGIKKVGLYDERFCNIGFQEADYMLRNILFNKQSSVIIDYYHNRLHDNFNINPYLFIQESEFVLNDSHIKSMNYHNVSRKWFDIKWNNFNPEHWNYSEIEKINDFLHKENVLYPYFESKINPNIYLTNKLF